MYAMSIVPFNRLDASDVRRGDHAGNTTFWTRYCRDTARSAANFWRLCFTCSPVGLLGYASNNGVRRFFFVFESYEALVRSKPLVTGHMVLVRYDE